VSLTKNNQDHEDVIVTFNGKNHKLKDWVKKEKAAVDDDSTLNWNKVFEEHTPKPVIGETAPTGFVPYKKVKKKRRTKSAKTTGIFVKQLWIPLMSAIIVGLGIGFTVLLVFSNHKAEKPPSVAASAQPVQATPADSSLISLAGNQFAVNLQVLQESSFDTLSAANDHIKQLKDKNIPAVVFNEGGDYKVFIGLAKDEGTRRELTGIFGDRQLYGKALSFTPNTIKTSKQIGDFLNSGKALMTDMIPLSSAKALDKNLSKDALSAIDKKLNQWASIDQLNVKGTLKKDLTSFRGAIESAYSHLENADDPDNAQQSLLDALGTYQKILLALSES